MASRRTRRIAWIGILLAGIAGVLFFEFATGATPYVRDRVVAALNAWFASDVELTSLQVGAFPRPAVTGSGLVLRYQGRTDVPPLITIDSFAGSAGLMGLRRTPMRFSTVELDGLEIHIPVGGLDGETDAEREDLPRTAPPARRGVAGGGERPLLFIDRIVSRAAALEIAPRDTNKLPRRFEIHDLEMRDFGAASGSPFRAALTNPVPRGRVDTEGTFGPWHTAGPRLTPVRGEYLFGNANLDTIKGIAGTLSSAGRYTGVLERIEVNGQTETPDFSIDVAGHSVPLRTTFAAIIDGTNGDTWLERIEATLGKTTIVARGAFVRAREVKGRQISLDVAIAGGRLEDLLALVVKAAKPPVEGAVAVKTRLVIPAGDEDVIDKLQLDGTFELARARFTNLNVQDRVNTLSRRGQGDGPVQDGESVVSNLRGRFAMRNASIQFSELTFAVPGAVVQLAGRYELRSEAIDFAGHLLLDAPLAEMTTGIKSVAARIAQPLFRRPGGGSRLPIRISGTRSQPSFGLDIRKSLLPG